MMISLEPATFRPRSRILQLLGDQLIGSHRLAVFELVKNAYDADASHVSVTIDGLKSNAPIVSVEDDGVGMTLATIQNIWLVLAHDHKAIDKAANIRTAKGRLPLGEKGLGRFSVHKLGNQIELITRAAGQDEVVVKINWNELIEVEFLDQTSVDITTRSPEHFVGDKTGTKIVISDLRQKRWTRGEIRRLQRQITSISSPFGNGIRMPDDVSEVQEFTADLVLPEFASWLTDIPDAASLLKRAPWKFTFDFDGENFSYTYEFRAIPSIARASRILKQDAATLLIPAVEIEDDDPQQKLAFKRTEKIKADVAMLDGIGPISGEFYVYDLDNKVLPLLGEQSLIRSFLDENGGVRVYRDGIRVYNYGEKDDDWLNLDLGRVNNPTRNLSRNIVTGYVSLSLEASNELQEKTNREGFVENEAFDRLRRLVLGIISPLSIEREIDKQEIKKLLANGRDLGQKNVSLPLQQIKKIAKKHSISSEIDPLVDRIETEYQDMKETLLKAGISGIGLAVVFHEIEQGVRSLHTNLGDTGNVSEAKDQIKELMRLLDGFSELLRKGDKQKYSLNHLIKRVRDTNAIRMRQHNIRLVCPALAENAETVESIFSFGLVLGALTNLLDNAVYWLKVKWDKTEVKPSKRAIYMDISHDFEGGPAIIISDTGPGFEDDREQLIRPFFTRRPEGMGMGLYYSNMVMEMNEGRLIVPENGDVELPEEFDGATVVLQFKSLD